MNILEAYFIQRKDNNHKGVFEKFEWLDQGRIAYSSSRHMHRLDLEYPYEIAQIRWKIPLSESGFLLSVFHRSIYLSKLNFLFEIANCFCHFLPNFKVC